MDTLFELFMTGESGVYGDGYGIGSMYNYLPGILAFGVSIVLIYAGYRHIRKAGNKI